jgi:hypothetical protein
MHGFGATVLAPAPARWGAPGAIGTESRTWIVRQSRLASKCTTTGALSLTDHEAFSALAVSSLTIISVSSDI